MRWELATAKNNEQTLKLNDVWLYSQYRPKADAWRWVDTNIDASSSHYFLIGLGLGYHLERLIERTNGKPITVYYFDEVELQLSNVARFKQANVHIVHMLTDTLPNGVQVLIPDAIIRAIGLQHPLHATLEAIKMNQVSYKKMAPFMQDNFSANQAWWTEQSAYPTCSHKVACLVASGPSLNETIDWLQSMQGKVDVFVVGSALKMLLQHHITPTAVVISDAQDNIIRQFTNSDFTGPLFYLSTANKHVVYRHTGERYVLFQEGYGPAEQYAKQHHFPLFETGGSVSTVTMSLLAHLNYKKIILFGQDLGFAGHQTHATLSTSGRTLEQTHSSRMVLANDGSMIQTTANLYTYAKWIEKKVKRMAIPVYTTAMLGMKLAGVEYITEQQLNQMIQ